MLQMTDTLKAVSWGTVGSQHWAGDRASKTHAFDCEIFNGGSHALTLCGREFNLTKAPMILEIAQTSESFGIDTIAISNFRAKTFLKHLTNGSTVNQQGRDRGDGQQLRT